MKRIFWFPLFFCCLLTHRLCAQSPVAWLGKKCAVVLTYDDALQVHLDQAVPALDSMGLKGTFFLSGSSLSFRKRMMDWKLIAGKGHELANHTLFHPCNGQLPGREWVKPDYDLSTYTLGRISDEIRMMNTLLQALDGKTQRTFAYPCGDTKIGEVAYLEHVKEEFVAARSVQPELQTIEQIDLMNVRTIPVNGQTGEELIAWVKKGMETHTLVVFLFHGVGGEHNLNVSLDAHRKLLQFLRQNQTRIWVAPFLEVMQHVKAVQQVSKSGKQTLPR